MLNERTHIRVKIICYKRKTSLPAYSIEVERGSCWWARGYSVGGMDKRNLYWQALLRARCSSSVSRCGRAICILRREPEECALSVVVFPERNSLTQWNVELRLTTADGLLVGGLGRSGRRQHHRPQHQPRTPLLLSKISNGTHQLLDISLNMRDKQISGNKKKENPKNFKIIHLFFLNDLKTIKVA